MKLKDSIGANIRRAGFVLALLVFAGVLAALLSGDFVPTNVPFSNDGPLGRLMAQCHRLPERLTGCWEDLNEIGSRGGTTVLNVSGCLHLLFSPLWFAKLYAPLSLLFLGLSAWFCFRQFRLTPAACLLGGLATMLNSGYFSTACWGMAAHPITVALTFLALGALADESSHQRWLRVMLAGLAVGMGVTEGADIGAMFSLLVAAFVVYQAWVAPGPRLKNAALGLGRLVLVTLCAAFLAMESVSELVSTSIEGVAGAEQDATTKAKRWDWATQWSFPKSETLSLIVPGLFGYRMLAPGADAYWGGIGRDPAWDKYFANGSQGPAPTSFLRYVGGGSYLGVPVVLLAALAVAQSLRRKESLFNLSQRKWTWFWLGISFISLLLAFGRFAPFYRLLYALPYASTVRNPNKFLHVFSFGIVVLFAFGADALTRRYLQNSGIKNASRWMGLKSWWGKASAFEKKWVKGCALALAASLVAWLIYAGYRESLEQYLESVLFDEAQATAIAHYSISQVSWFVLFFVLAAGLVVLILSGAFLGKRAKWGVVWMAALLIVDLGRANLPWIYFYNYKEKYASNPVIEFLRQQPYEHRVALLRLKTPTRLPPFQDIYREEWLEHLFPYYNIQSLENIQVSRKSEELTAFEKALDPKVHGKHAYLRSYQLTNTRYLFGPADFAGVLNAQFDPQLRRFKIIERFNVVPRPPLTRAETLDQMTVQLDPNGTFAMMEFPEILPRAKLYAHWQVETNRAAILERLADESFDPTQTVFVQHALPTMPEPGTTNLDAGTVDFVSYAPRDIVLKAQALMPSVLLFNDRYDPHWQVLVDGKPERLLHCNYIMRGVFLNPGAHRVEFHFHTPTWPLYLSFAADGVALLLLGFTIAGAVRNTPKPAPPGPGASPGPASSQPKPSPKQAPAGAGRPRQKVRG